MVYVLEEFGENASALMIYVIISCNRNTTKVKVHRSSHS